MIKNLEKNTSKVFPQDLKNSSQTSQTQPKSDTIKEIIYNDPYLNKNDRRILFYLIKIVEKQYLNLGLNYARVLQSTIASKQKLSIDQVKRAISKLKKYSYITINRINKINLYFINFKKFTPYSHSNHTSITPESHLKKSQNTFQEKISKKPYNNYNSFNNSNKQLQQIDQNSKKSDVVVSFELEEKTRKTNLSIYQVKHFVSEGYSINLIKKCLECLLWIQKHQKCRIENISGYFANMITRSHKGEWDFTSFDECLIKETKRKTLQIEAENKENIETIQEHEIYENIEKKWLEMSENDKEELLKKAKHELPNFSEFFHENLAKFWLMKDIEKEVNL